MAHSVVKRVSHREQVKNFTEDLTKFTVKVGWPEPERYPRPEVEKQIAAERGGPKHKSKTYKHSPSSKPGELVSVVAYANEFGHGVPARPFIRPTIKKENAKWSRLMSYELKEALHKKISVEKAFDIVGQKVEGDIRETITQVYSPPLADATIKARLSKYAKQDKIGNLTKPLVETGYMLNTLTSKVEKK